MHVLDTGEKNLMPAATSHPLILRIEEKSKIYGFETKTLMQNK